jgi:antitoxin MazE
MQMARMEKCDDGLALRFSLSEATALGLVEGDEVEIGSSAPLSFTVTRRPSREALMDRLRAFRGRIPSDFRFDREDANSRAAEVSPGPEN